MKRMGLLRDARKQALTRPASEARHVVTDPACDYYVEPLSWHERRKFDAARGRGCPICMEGDQ